MKLNFELMVHFKWSLDEIENMIPWEREVYVAHLTKYIEEENQRLQEQSRSR